MGAVRGRRGVHASESSSPYVRVDRKLCAGQMLGGLPFVELAEERVWGNERLPLFVTRTPQVEAAIENFHYAPQLFEFGQCSGRNKRAWSKSLFRAVTSGGSERRRLLPAECYARRTKRWSYYGGQSQSWVSYYEGVKRALYDHMRTIETGLRTLPGLSEEEKRSSPRSGSDMPS